MPARRLIRVDLPAPFSPISAWTSPARTSKSTASRTGLPWKLFDRSVAASMTGSIAAAEGAQGVEADSGDQHHADGRLLPVRVAVEQHEAVADQGQHEHARERAQDAARTAGEASAAYDGGRKGAELHPMP